MLQTALTAVGVPIVAWLVGANRQPIGDYARKHPWQILALLAAYESAVFIGWFVREVWKKLSSPLIDFCADRLTRAVQARFSRFEKDYSRNVRCWNGWVAHSTGS